MIGIYDLVRENEAKGLSRGFKVVFPRAIKSSLDKITLFPVTGVPSDRGLTNEVHQCPSFRFRLLSHRLLAVQPWLSCGTSKSHTKPTDKPLSEYKPVTKMSGFARANSGSDFVITLIY